MSAAHALPPRRLGWILAFYCCLHIAIALWLNWGALSAALVSLDSEWYEHIARHGYVHNPGSPQPAESVFAFFPTWPLILRAASSLWPASIPLPYLGSLIALALFLTVVNLMNKRTDKDPLGLTPRTSLGLWCLIFAPGAWVFFSNHTEALFLMLSWGAFATAARGEGKRSFLAASVLAGLAALTRNQGVLVAFFVGWTLAARAPQVAFKERLRPFILSGLLSAALFALWPLFQWLETGNPFMSSAAQKHWYFAQDVTTYVKNFFWFSANNFWRALTFWGCLVVGMRLTLAGPKSRPLGLYVFVSALLWPLQGNNLPQAYRFSSVLFPFWFWLGDTLAERFASKAEILRSAQDDGSVRDDDDVIPSVARNLIRPVIPSVARNLIRPVIPSVARNLLRPVIPSVARNLLRLAFLVATIILSSAYYTRVRWAY